MGFKRRYRRRNRQPGTGSVFKRASDGQWVGRYHGKVVYGRSEAEAEVKLVELRVKVDKGAYVEPSKMTVDQFLDRWLMVIKPTIEPTTYYDYETKMRHVRKHLGQALVTKLTSMDIEGLLAAMEKGGSGAVARKAVRTIFHVAMQYAADPSRRLISSNPVTSVKPPKIVKTRVGAWSAEDARKFLDAAKGEFLYPLFYVAISTGLRPSELLGLQWAEIDLAAGKLAVCQKLVEINGSVTGLRPVKTANSNRVLTIGPDVVELLKKHKVELLRRGLSASPFVFPNARGRGMHKAAVRRRIRAICDLAGIKRLNFHQASRHTSATILLQAGVHPKVVQSRLGHSKVGVTLDIYSHVLPTMDAEAADTLANMITKPPAEDPEAKQA